MEAIELINRTLLLLIRRRRPGARNVLRFLKALDSEQFLLGRGPLYKRYLSTTGEMPRCRIQAHCEQLPEFERGLIIGLKTAVFSNEPRFQLCPDDQRRRVWRRPGKRADPAFTIVCPTGFQPMIMIWGAFPFDCRTTLVVIRDTITAQRYVDDILRTALLPFLLSYPGLIFQQDNFSIYGTAIRGFSSGRPLGTTPADDRYIVLQARRNKRQTAGEIARHTTQATGRPISRFTVHRGGLFARRPVRCVPLTPAHRRRHSLWCPEHRNWRDNEWGRVLFTDESRFSLSSDSHHILIWRERGSRNHPSNIIERDRYGGRGVLVWGGIMLGSRTDLHIFDAVPFHGDDNAPCHRIVAATVDWPARSPDLNPIEHVWDFLGRRLAARTLPPVTIRELRLALQDEWAAMPQQLIDTLILSIGRRRETCLAVRGDHIPY
ncbi:transposable element Tcb2 transposase [Trichonephila clavipes]|nr:transposable element Tcb2 transposase [Trichonephila clavipes]